MIGGLIFLISYINKLNQVMGKKGKEREGEGEGEEKSKP